MNSVFRFLMLAALAMTFTVVSFAQDPCADYDAQKALYAKFTDLYPKTALADRKAAVAVAQEYIDKYGSCPEGKAQSDYFKNYIPPVKKGIEDEENAVIKKARYDRFNNAMTAKNWNEVYAAGKDIIAAEPGSEIAFNITIALGSIGLDESKAGRNNLNAETLKYAKLAIDDLNAGKSSKTWGVAYKGGPNFAYKNKEEALGWLNYTIAYLNYYGDKTDASKKDSIAYFYKATQSPAVVKNYPEVYYAIGSTYYAELTRLENDRQAKLKANNPDEKDQKKWKDTDETKQIFALEKGYADRVLDAYSRVYNTFPATVTDPKAKAAKDSTYTDLKSVYEFRFQGKEKALDALIASTKSKALPDPSTPVTPVVEVEPTPATTTTTGATGTTTTPATTTPATTTPATTTKPATTTPATKPAATPTPVKPATATKPAPKKTNPKR